MRLRLGLSFAIVIHALGCSGRGDGASGGDDDASMPTTPGCATADGCGDAGSDGSDAGSPSAKECPGGLLTGDYQVASAADAAAISKCRRITGSLTFSVGGEPVSLSLPELVSVGETLACSNSTSLTGLSLPALTAVGLDLYLYNCPTLNSASMPALTQVYGEVYVRFEHALTSLIFPSLEEVREDFSVGRNDRLTGLSFPALTTIGGDLEIQDNPMLPTSQANALREQLVDFDGMVRISGNQP